METKVREPWPTAWLAIAFGSRRIRCHACDFEFFQKAIGGQPEPAHMPRLECHTAIELFSQYGEKRASDTGVECEARRQLHQQAPEARAQRREVCEERLERRGAIGEPLVMRDRARELDGKPERARYARGPTSNVEARCGR